MTRKREGCSQLAFEVPDDLLAAMKKAAAKAGQKLTVWICSVCAAEVEVAYNPPKLGRPPDEPPPKKTQSPRPAPNSRARGRRG